MLSPTILEQVRLLRFFFYGKVDLVARGVGCSPYLAPFYVEAFLFQLLQLVSGVVFAFGGNVVRGSLDVSSDA